MVKLRLNKKNEKIKQKKHSPILYKVRKHLNLMTTLISLKHALDILKCGIFINY